MHSKEEWQHHRPLASFGRRKGRSLRTTRQTLVDTLLPQLEISSVVMESWSGGGEKKMCSSLFPHYSTTPSLHHPLWLEIGFGGGEHLAHQAALYPHVGIIGCEPYINGIGDLLKKIDAQKLSNIRIFTDDARLLIEELPDSCLEKVFISYPDPWPKTRHHKRRLVSKETLDMLARVMKKGAELRLATDHADYATWMLEQLLTHPNFTWTAQCASDWKTPPSDWIPTRYEQKRLAGTPTYLNFTRS
ncbi:MAG: tRNA (guanosine(46)-N7)-methyltransferase TrmB [Alphaproteobacteria bacterium]